MTLTMEEMVDLVRKWQDNRPEGAKYPRVQVNPYDDNTIGIAFDEGWWTALQYALMHNLFRP